MHVLAFIARVALALADSVKGWNWVITSKFLAVASMAIFVFPATGAQYVASGLFDGEYVDSQGKRKSFETFPFEVVVSNCNWLIKVRTYEFSTVGTDLFASFDGEYNYTFGAYPQPSPDGQAWQATIANGRVPFFGPIPHQPVIWMALASECYLHRQSDQEMVPPYATQSSRRPMRNSIKWHGNDRGSVPEWWCFYEAGKLPSGLPTTNAIFSASKFQPVDGTWIPTEFSVTVFRNASTAGLFPVRREYRGVVTNIGRATTVLDFRPQLPETGHGYVQDFRFGPQDATNDHYFDYSASNWLSLSEVRMLPQFARYAALMPELLKIPTATTGAEVYTIPGSSTKRRAVLLCLAGLALIGTTFFLWWLPKTNTKQTKTKQN